MNGSFFFFFFFLGFSADGFEIWTNMVMDQRHNLLLISMRFIHQIKKIREIFLRSLKFYSKHHNLWLLLFSLFATFIIDTFGMSLF